MKPISNTPAGDKILSAAARVFARDGLHGATTRGIANEAGVSEVTLFRLFESKEKLLAAVLSEACSAQTKRLESKGEWTGVLRDDLMAYAQSYNTMLEQNEAMIRTLIGEAQRHPEHARQLIRESVKSSRTRFIAYLKQARLRGQVRAGINLDAAADMLTGMLLAGMLRRTAHRSGDYSAKVYLMTCVDVFVAGIAEAGKKKTSRSLKL